MRVGQDLPPWAGYISSRTVCESGPCYLGTVNMMAVVRLMKNLRWRIVSAACTALLLAACGTASLAPIASEAPLFRQIDARVGVVYTSAASTAVIANPLMRFEVGKACVEDFTRVFSSMFSQPTALPDWPPWRHARPDVDGVVEVESCNAEMKLGDDTGRNPDMVTANYRVCLYEPGGEPVKCWSASASQRYARGLFECMNLGQCMAMLADSTMREAMARFLAAAENDPDLRAWQARVEQGRKAR